MNRKGKFLTICAIILGATIALSPTSADAAQRQKPHKQVTTTAVKPKPKTELAAPHTCTPEQGKDGEPDFAPLIVVHAPNCLRVWINPSDIAGVREVAPQEGSPPAAHAEIFSHDERQNFVRESAEDVAALIPGLVLLHAPTGRKIWINAQEVTGVRAPIPGITGDVVAHAEVFMHDRASKFVLETPAQVAGAIAEALRQK